METHVQSQELFQYAEVYISDLLSLKNIFLQIQNGKKVNRNFGLPFLLAKKKDEIIMFASLIIDERNEINCKVYSKKEITECEKEIFASRAESYVEKSSAPNFRNPEQLRNSISRTISWLNL